MKINNAKIGTDPELFLYSPLYGKYVPVCGLVGGTKEEPIPINEENKGYSLQEDNVALEFTIPPATTKTEFINSINFVKNYITETILKPLELIPHYVASARFNEDDLSNPAAQHMGCSKSYDAWSFEEHQVDRSDYTLRTTGMHIHVGYDNPNDQTSIDIIRAMDLFLGVPSVLIDPDNERRKMYGKAGDFRMKKYGVEYRVLSSYFIQNDQLIGWVYDQTQAAINFVNQGGIITNPGDIIDAVNSCNQRIATDIIKDYNLNINNIKQLI